MAKCDLSIELDQPDVIHPGGGTITGLVRVVVDGDVKCSGLEVQSVWRTHGRGNVASGTAGQATLFSGQWNEGETTEYRFELPIAQWPPTYHGHYLNIDHFVDARAKIPWSFDPKATASFMVHPTCGSEQAKVVKPVTEMNNLIGCIIGFMVLAFMAAFLTGMAVAGPFSLIFLALPTIGFLIWFFRKFLPRWLLGEVVGRFPVEMICPGETVEGELTIEPKKAVSINGITMQFQAREQCISGSGSNRTTHKHVFYDQTEVLQEATTLAAGVKHRFPLPVSLPADAPFSLDLDDNKLIWSATLRVDIPRWPDWVKEVPITVVPAVESSEGVTTVPRVRTSAAPVEADRFEEEPVAREEGITFAETVTHLWSLRDKRDQVEMLVEAVTGLSFKVEAFIERRLLYAGDDDPHLFEDGYAVWAHYPDPPLPLVLYVPHQLADEFEQIGRDRWRGRGTIVGWDHGHGRLQIKLEQT